MSVSLSRLAALWNSDTPVPTANLLVDALSVYYTSLALQNRESIPLRMSNLGKPLPELVYQMKYGNSQSTSRADLFRASVGVWCEALLISLAADAGLDVVDNQREVTIDFPGYFTLIGHIDGVADGNCVFDIKCVNAQYFKKFSNELCDDRGYITQLALYQVATKCPNACFLLVNSNNGYAKLQPVPQRLLNQALEDVKQKLSILFSHSLDDLLRKYSPKNKALLKNGKYL